MHEPATLEIFSPEDLWSRSLLAKVEGLIPTETFDNLSRCGRQELYRTCKECRTVETRYYRCSLKFCPQCNWRIARERAELLRHWTKRIEQPKHLVLTRRNETGVLTRKLFRQTMRAFAKLRHLKLWKPVKGGCVSMELTNEGRGWHVHLHILADVRWLDAGEIARRWGKLVGQDYAIVKVKDCRGAAYLGEVTKYVVKGAELVSWKPEEIAQFIFAIKGVKFFSTFGTLFKLRREISVELEAEKPPPPVCECGCDQFWWETEESSIIRDCK